MIGSMKTAELVSDGWIRPHEIYADGDGPVAHWENVRECEVGPDGVAQYLEADDAVRVAGNVALAKVTTEDVGGWPCGVVRFPDGSRLTFHAWRDGSASGWWWTGDGIPASVASGISEDADLRLADAEDRIRDAFTDLAAGRRDAVAVALAGYVAAVQDADAPPIGDAPAVWISAVTEAAAAGVRDARDRDAWR